MLFLGTHTITPLILTLSNFTIFFITDAINTYSFLLLCIEELEVPMTIFGIRSEIIDLSTWQVHLGHFFHVESMIWWLKSVPIKHTAKTIMLHC